MKPTTTLAALVIALTAGAFAANLSFAAGGGGDGTSPAEKCKKGDVWDKKRKLCVHTQSGVLPDEDLYEQGRMLAKTGHYDWALQVLAAIGDQNDPRVLNYTGYSHRKLGQFELGFSYYKKALALDPDFVLAREYLGEGYVATGRIDLAKLELAEIEKRCGTTCEEYQDLAEAIATPVN